MLDRYGGATRQGNVLWVVMKYEANNNAIVILSYSTKKEKTLNY